MRNWLRSQIKWIGGMALLLWLGGCAQVPKPLIDTPKPDDPNFAPTLPPPTAKPLMATGSLFDANSQDWFSDQRAKRVGDIIYIQLKERTSARNSANSSLSKSSNYNLNPVVGLGGKNVNIGGESLQVGVSSAGDFAGQSGSKQSNSLQGSIAVHVVAVAPNGNLTVRGEKWLQLNQSKEFVRLSGIVRSADVGVDNQVQSSKVANARIDYGGTGPMAQAQVQGWLSRFFNHGLWPF